MTRQMGGNLKIVYVDKGLFKDFPMPDAGEGVSHIKISTYFRLFLPLLLPSTVEKLIYLDCDIVVRHSLKPLFDEDITDYYLGAVYHTNDAPINNGSFVRLNIPQSQGYFNAGVLLINLEKWRQDGIYEKCMAFLHTDADKIVNHDQDVLNVVCGGNTKLLPCTWNCTNGFLYKSFMSKDDRIARIYKEHIDETISDPAVVHFAYRPKPWEIICVHPYRNDFIKCLKMTPYKKVNYKWPTLFELSEYFIKPQFLGYGRFRRGLRKKC
jgi:lipopolysaccharide biosynthesis glycosyltransferase